MWSMVFPSTPRTHPLSADTHERASEYQRKADEMRTRALHALEPDARAAFHQMATGYEL